MQVSNVKANNTRANDTSVNTTSVSSMKVNRTSRADLAGRHVVALGLAIVSFTASERAAAECAPQSPVNDQVVTCTGTTSNQNSPDGYGTTGDTGNTIKVESGASVTGDGNGLIFNDGTVHNRGTISAGEFGSGIFAINTAT
jgi:hypothetical protein